MNLERTKQFLLSSPEALPTRQVDRVMVQILSLTKSTKESNVGSVEQLPQLKREQFQGYGLNEYPREVHLLHYKKKKRVSIHVNGTGKSSETGTHLRSLGPERSLENMCFTRDKIES